MSGEPIELSLGPDPVNISNPPAGGGGPSSPSQVTTTLSEAPPPYDEPDVHIFPTLQTLGSETALIPDTETGTGSGTEAKQRKAGLSAIFRLFRYATYHDWLLMLVGTVTAIAHGTALPLAMLVFGLLTNVFVNFFSSQQLANTELTFDLADFADEVGFLNIRIDLLMSGFINFTNFTGGVVNCSEDFEAVPDGNNFNDLLQVGVTQLASCLDAEMFNEEVLIYIWAFLGIAGGVFVLAYFQIKTFQIACERQVYEIQLSFYRAILRQDIGWFDTNPTGELSSRLADDIEKIHDGIGDKLAIFIQWVSTFFTGFIIGFVIEWRLTLVLLGAMPFIAISAAVFSKLTAAATNREQQQYASAGAVAEEVLSSIRTVVAFGGEYKEAERYDKRLKDARRTGFLKGVIGGCSLGIIFFFIFAVYAIAFWFSAWLISKEIVQAGEVLTVFFAVLIAAFSIGQAIPNLEKLVISAGASVSIYNIIDRVPLIDSSSPEGDIPETFSSTIDFTNVNFSYPTRPTVPVLQDFNLNIEVGQTVALVGHSGCGKSTAVQLLLRFYDISSGQILVGGRDIRELNLRWLRDHIGVVSQEPVLFDTTIAENIRFGHLAATTEEIERAAQKANAHDFISQLPMGYNTLVGERGTQLSGGQKQRIAIARALVKDPKILLLDEATSALDSASEAIVQSALDRAREGRTTIVIAHRLSTIQNADLIAAMADGKVVEIGTHSQLLAMKGLYNGLVTAQMQPDFDNPLLSPKHKPSEGGAWTRHVEASLAPEDTGLPTKVDEDTTQKKKKKEKKISAKQQEIWDKELPEVPWFEILGFNLKHWWEGIVILLGLAGATVQGAIFPCFALFFGEILVVFTLPSGMVLEETHMWAGFFLMLGGISAVAQFLKIFCFTVSGEILTCRLRSKTFRAMLRQEVAWFDDQRNSTGALTARLANDAGQVQGATGSRLGTIFETLIGMAVALVIAFTASWVLSLAVLGLVPFVAIGGFLQLKVLIGFASNYKKAVEEAGKIAVDSIDNMRTVAALSAEDAFYHLYKQEVAKPYKNGLYSAVVYGITYGFSQAILFVGYVVTFRFGAYLITRPVNHLLYLRFEELFKVFIALIFGALAIGQAGAFAPSYAKAKLSARRIFALLQRQPDIDNYSEEGSEISDPTGELNITDVEFSYPARPSVRVLQGLSARVKPGQTLALVGASGCGKTTVVSLIERFYDPKSGQLELDSVNIKDLKIRWLRSQLGIVFQEPVLFDCSIAENIRYGANFREVSDEEVLAAAKAANIHSFIDSLPQGYDTNVGGKGTQLSGGQKQRVAIARALVRNPRVLLLDEATSALDTESEKIVQAALDEACVGRTCIVIAHRLSTVYNADCIAVIQEGRVVEMGSHSELIALGGIYHKLHSHQMLAR